MRSSLKFNNKSRVLQNGTLQKQNLCPSFPFKQKKKTVRTQSSALELVAKQSLYDLSESENNMRENHQTVEFNNCLPEITPWNQQLQGKQLDNQQVHLKQKDDRFWKLKYHQFGRHQVGRVATRAKLREQGYSQIIKYPSQKCTTIHNCKVGQILVLDQVSSMSTSKPVRNQVLSLKQQKSLKSYNMSKASKQVQFLRDQILTSIQKETIVPLKVCLTDHNTKKIKANSCTKTLLRRKYSLKGKLQPRQQIYECNNPLTRFLYERYLKTLNKSGTVIS